MKNKYLILLILMISMSCKSQEIENVKIEVKEKLSKKDEIVSLKYFKIKTDNILTYNQIKKSIQKKIETSNQIDNDSIAQLFELCLLNRIIPRWENTPWSFEGHTSIPQKGEIACGYFVSTTLRDVGMNLNRYKLAQQSPINEAKSLSLNRKVITIFEEDINKRILKIKNNIKDGIHFIGFDESHVGYIYKKGQDLYLIHSNYLGGERVEIEKVEKSEVFQSFIEIHLVELSTSKEFLYYWRNRKEIKIIT